MGKPLHEPAWLKHYQNVWLDRSSNLVFPDWFRVMALAYGTARANGHACFLRGEMAAHLDIPGTSVSRAIRTAKEYGVIAPESNANCLVVPPHAVVGGLGNAYDRCAVHDAKRTGQRKPFNPVAKQRRSRPRVESKVRAVATAYIHCPVCETTTNHETVSGIARCIQCNREPIQPQAIRA